MVTGRWDKSALRQEALSAVEDWAKQDPAHLQLERATRKLDLLIARGLGDVDGGEAEKLRDEMDGIWKALSESEHAWFQRRLARIERQKDAAKKAKDAAKTKRGAQVAA